RAMRIDTAIACMYARRSCKRLRFDLKVECILRIFEDKNVAWALWFDSDVGIMTDIPAEQWLQEAEARSASVIVQHMGPRINNGIFWVKNDDVGRQFLLTWQAITFRPYLNDNGKFNPAVVASRDPLQVCGTRR